MLRFCETQQKKRRRKPNQSIDGADVKCQQCIMNCRTGDFDELHHFDLMQLCFDIDKIRDEENK